MLQYTDSKIQCKEGRLVDFVDWLVGELEQRGWTNSELARRASVVPSTVSQIISGKQNPGEKFCRGAAQAFNIPPSVIFRLAGILPPRPRNPDFEELEFYFDKITPEQQKTVVAMTRGLYLEGREKKGKKRANTSEPCSA